ncbi:hypothetical protein E3N88_06356 [Mikania micrantha]|uniref:Uncharacterized protein n=1 Tax=Mikania micrantha TaxID=192012 RepID=A0A5N6PQV9_9ASTR|nr:hypothetical protein E3N88_06356 [Mikania micrantha]
MLSEPTRSDGPWSGGLEGVSRDQRGRWPGSIVTDQNYCKSQLGVMAHGVVAWREPAATNEDVGPGRLLRIKTIVRNKNLDMISRFHIGILWYIIPNAKNSLETFDINDL